MVVLTSLWREHHCRVSYKIEFKTELKNIEALLNTLTALLSTLPQTPDVPAEELDDRFPQIQAYLTDFENWRLRVERENPLSESSPGTAEEKAQLRAAIERLYERHLEFSGRVSLLKRDVARQLGEVHQRGRALKAYIDRYPSRITIAGKRKG